jgi:hypothetical protein
MVYLRKYELLIPQDKYTSELKNLINLKKLDYLEEMLSNESRYVYHNNKEKQQIINYKINLLRETVEDLFHYILKEDNISVTLKSHELFNLLSKIEQNLIIYKFKETYYKIKYGKKLERFYIKNIKNKNVNTELLYSPKFKFYKNFLHPITLQLMNI